MEDRQAKANREGALGWIRCMEAGDFPGIFRLHSEDVVVNLLGTTPVSGHVVGRDTYFEYTNTEIMGGLDPTQEPWLKGWRLACVDHNAAAIFFHGSFPPKDGHPDGRYEQNYLAVAQACEGIIYKLTEMADTAMIEKAAYRRRLQTPRSKPESPYDLSLERGLQEGKGSRERNIRLAEDWMRALGQNDMRAYEDMLHTDLVSNIVGWTPYSGRRRGRDAYMGCDFDFHSSKKIRSGRDFGTRYRLMCADENGFCLLMRGGGVLTNGTLFDQFYSIVATVVDDRISELHIHFDTAKAENLIFDNPYTNPPSKTSPHKQFSIY